jgi:hypothetical protein
MNIVERSKDILLEVGAAPILYLMIALSVMSIAVMLERAWFFFVSSEDLGRLAQALRGGGSRRRSLLDRKLALGRSGHRSSRPVAW